MASERPDNGEDARATVSNQQMRNGTSLYPVDRYLVESSTKFDLVNIIDDDIWNTEPVLRPEDEILLRKLHEMLQSTADDLKLLSGELSKFQEPVVQPKMPPTPLDEEFNEKVHIEEVVNAKFHGYKIVEKRSHPLPEHKSLNSIKHDAAVGKQQPKVSNSTAQANAVQIPRKRTISRNLGITRTKIMEVNVQENSPKTEYIENLNKGVFKAPVIAYNEFSYKYEEPNHKIPYKNLRVQEMPKINIRGELKEQKVLLLDIIPDAKENEKADMITKNIAVVAVQHNSILKPVATTSYGLSVQYNEKNKPSVRRISKLSTCESSGSTITGESDSQSEIKSKKRVTTSVKHSIKSCSARNGHKQDVPTKEEKRTHFNPDEWRKKLNSVYGISNKKRNIATNKGKLRVSPKKIKVPSENKSNTLNNVEYIPYSKLTVGGVRASDIEKEILDIPDKKDIPLSPILDRILSSRENSFSRNSPQKYKAKGCSKIFTTSDENLLQEVIDIERTVSETLSKDKNKPVEENLSNNTEESDSYADDFEEDKSEPSSKSVTLNSNRVKSDGNKIHVSSSNELKSEIDYKSNLGTSIPDIRNRTYTKNLNLSFKNSVDVYEFVHSVDMQDSATQSNTIDKISPKETQTSPRNDTNIQPIRNDLWAASDPITQVEKMFKMEKEFIKNLIIEEYGDLLEKNYSKPSTSTAADKQKNVVALQKDTQTSPARVKHIMTSPPKTKTRTTSPFGLLTVDHHTSPLIFVTNEKNVQVEIEEEDLGISINLSPPRFSLRLPQNSKEVLSNLGDTQQMSAHFKKSTNSKRNIVTSSSSTDVDSSEISSLGEIKLKLRRQLRKGRLPSTSESSSSTTTINSSDLQSGILPLRSEGEMSLGNKKSIHSKSEGEASFGML